MTKDTDDRIPSGLSSHYRVQHCQHMEALPQTVGELEPSILCFDFGYPGPSELALLQKIKLLYPSVLILMLTENHSTELVIWAFRARVWDCFLKPASDGEIVRRLNIMLPVFDVNNRQHPRKVLMPDRCSFKSSAVEAGTPSQDKTRAVMPYLSEHFHEKVALSDMARMCRMGTCEFSRTFRREQGMTFRDYLVRRRVEAAASILRHSQMTILNVACSVGINDPSQFSRLFRRHMGVTPTAYRSQ